MTDTVSSSATLPARRDDLVIRPIGKEGRYVVKIPHTNDYFHLGEEEHFLLLQLNGMQDAAAVCAAFQTKFGDALTADDLDGFLEMARGQKLLGEGRGDAATRRRGDREKGPLVPLRTPIPSLRVPSKASSSGGKASSIPTGSSTCWSRRSVSAGRAGSCLSRSLALC